MESAKQGRLCPRLRTRDVGAKQQQTENFISSHRWRAKCTWIRPMWSRERRKGHLLLVNVLYALPVYHWWGPWVTYVFASLVVTSAIRGRRDFVLIGNWVYPSL
jgi:hypothetical protein